MEEYFVYSYCDELGNYIGVFDENTPEDIIEIAKQKYDIVKKIKGTHEY